MVNLSSNQSVKPSYPVREAFSEGVGNRPWAIARILPNAKVYIVARFRNRQDADDHVRILHRFIRAAKFEIIFDLPNEEENELTLY